MGRILVPETPVRSEGFVASRTKPSTERPALFAAFFARPVATGLPGIPCPVPPCVLPRASIAQKKDPLLLDIRRSKGVDGS